MKVAGIIRKSPTNKKVEESIDKQKAIIKEKVFADFPDQEIKIDWYIDIAKGDDPKRKKLNLFFSRIDKYPYAYCYHPDRFARSWLGIKWFHEYFT